MDHCLWCGRSAALLSSTQKGYKEPEIFNIYHCEHCNTSFSSPRTSSNKIYELIYQHGAFVPGYNRYYYFAEQVLKERDPIAFLIEQEPTYWSVFHSLKELSIPKEARLLEVGSGFGYFTYSLRKAGYKNLYGMDISVEAVANAKSRYGDYYICADLYSYVNENRATYDAIILTEVIEHIDDAFLFLSKLMELLAPNGVVLLTTPNRSFHPKESIWNTENPPIHCWWFSEQSFIYFGRKKDVSVQFIDFTPYYKGRTPDYIKAGYLHNSAYIFDSTGSLLRSKRRKRHKNRIIHALSQWSKQVMFCLSKWMGVNYYSIAGEKSWTLCVHLRKG